VGFFDKIKKDVSKSVCDIKEMKGHYSEYKELKQQAKPEDNLSYMERMRLEEQRELERRLAAKHKVDSGIHNVELGDDFLNM